MKYLLTLILTLGITNFASAQKAQDLIAAVNKKFATVNDYKANVHMKFVLPGIKIKDIKGKVFFKKPSKFKIRAKGIFFVPRQNPMKNIPALLANTSSYTAVISGYATVSGKKCAVVNVIPFDTDKELIIGKFWISVDNPLVYMSEITTKKNGTIRTKSYYGKHAAQGLPDKVLIQVEMKKFKIPKVMAMDMKKNQGRAIDKKKTGDIYMVISNYEINTKLSNSVFSKK